jgi:type IV pilus assembly protein PilQ
MFSMIRYLMAAVLLAAPTVVIGASAEVEPPAGSPVVLAQWADQQSAAPAESYMIAQDDLGFGADAETDESGVRVGQQVLEFEFEGPEPVAEPVPDLLDTEVFNRRVTLDFKNADIQNVIRLIAARTGLNILMNPREVDGRITLSLDNVPLRDALDNILKVNKLAYIIETGNILRIVPEGRVGRGTVETQTIVVELNWRDAADIQETMGPFLTSHGDIQANAETQTVIITDVPPNLLLIQDLIAQIDHPDRQVIIQARLVDILEAWGRTLSSQFGVRKNDDTNRITALPGAGVNNFGFTDFGVPGVSVEGASFTATGGTVAFGTQLSVFGDEYDIDAVLTALESQNIVQVLASPRVTTLNNVPASIKIEEEIPYTQANRADSGSTSFNVQFEKVGVSIDVKPVITPNSFVRLDISLNQRINRGRVAFASEDALGAGLAPLQISTRTADSSVIVEDRNTVVLGGLRQLDSRENNSGTPWLMKIPILGWLFKDRGNDAARSNLVLMVTPEIVDQALLSDVEQELYNRLDDDWHMPDYFLDDLHQMTHYEDEELDRH